MGGLVTHKGWSDIGGSTEMIFPFVFYCWPFSLSKRRCKRVGKFVIWACERVQKGFLKSRKRPVFVIDHYLNNNAFTAVKRDVKV